MAALQGSGRTGYLCGPDAAITRKKEIVEIAGVGRLYLDFEGQYKFMPGPQNFHTPSFGLPEVQFNPIKRQPAQAQVQEAPPIVARPSSVPFWKKINWQSPVLWVLSLAVLVLFVSIYYLVGVLNSPVISGGAVRPVPGSSIDTATDFDDEEPELDEDNAFVTGSLGELVDTEGATRIPGIKEAIVIIGSFKDDVNAEKQIQTLFSDGYEAYTDKLGGATRVGIRLGVESAEELQEKLKVIQSRYNKRRGCLHPNNNRLHLNLFPGTKRPCTFLSVVICFPVSFYGECFRRGSLWRRKCVVRS
ncbi:MAG: hypothetical protein IPJ40_20365 [Saprospirales bacterium]|nr:hypothetical protein [Saprospirales bacterium]